MWTRHSIDQEPIFWQYRVRIWVLFHQLWMVQLVPLGQISLWAILWKKRIFSQYSQSVFNVSHDIGCRAGVGMGRGRVPGEGWVRFKCGSVPGCLIGIYWPRRCLDGLSAVCKGSFTLSGQGWRMRLHWFTQKYGNHRKPIRFSVRILSVWTRPMNGPWSLDLRSHHPTHGLCELTKVQDLRTQLQNPGR